MIVPEAGRIVAALDTVWGEIPKDRAKFIIEGISDLPYAETMAAVKALILTRSTMPAIATIRRSVMHTAGILPPPPEVALGQAEAWAEYQGECAFVNGSGWRPVMPDVHPAVVRACTGLGDMTHPSWPSAFRRVYSDVVADAEADILGSDFTLVAGALGSGS